MCDKYKIAVMQQIRSKYGFDMYAYGSNSWDIDLFDSILKTDGIKLTYDIKQDVNQILNSNYFNE